MEPLILKSTVTKLDAAHNYFAGNHLVSTCRWDVPAKRCFHHRNETRKNDPAWLITLLGRFVIRDIYDAESGTRLCRAGRRITVETALKIAESGQVEEALRSSNRVRLQASEEEERLREMGDYLYDSAKDHEIEKLEEDE